MGDIQGNTVRYGNHKKLPHFKYITETGLPFKMWMLIAAQIIGLLLVSYHHN